MTSRIMLAILLIAALVLSLNQIEDTPADTTPPRPIEEVSVPEPPPETAAPVVDPLAEKLQQSVASGAENYQAAHQAALKAPQVVLIHRSSDFSEVDAYVAMLEKRRETGVHTVNLDGCDEDDAAWFAAFRAETPYLTLCYPGQAAGYISIGRTVQTLDVDIQGYYRWKNRQLETANRGRPRRTCADNRRRWFRGGG